MGFDHIKNRHALYRGKDCMQTFCESLRKHTKNVTDFRKKNMLPLTKCKRMLHLWNKNLNKAL